MDDPIEKYLDEVMSFADLAPGDQRQVRAELRDHLERIAEQSNLTNPREVLAMLNNEFGQPGQIGGDIAAAKGRKRTYFKKLARKLAISVAAIVVLTLGVRSTIAQPFYCPGTGVAPAVPSGSYVLVYKLASSYKCGDVIVFRNAEGGFRLGFAIMLDSRGNLIVSRNGQPDQTVPLQRVVGRVVLITR